MKSNLETEEDVKEYLAFLRRVRKEVDAWPDYKKVDGYATRKWRLKPKERNNDK